MSFILFLNIQAIIFFPRVTPGNRLRIMSNVVWGGIKKVAKKPANLKLKAVWKGAREFIPAVSMQEAQTHPGHVVRTHTFTLTAWSTLYSPINVCVFGPWERLENLE